MNYVLFYIFINIILAAKVGCAYYRYISSILNLHQYYWSQGENDAN